MATGAARRGPLTDPAEMRRGPARRGGRKRDATWKHRQRAPSAPPKGLFGYGGGTPKTCLFTRREHIAQRKDASSGARGETRETSLGRPAAPNLAVAKWRGRPRSGRAPRSDLASLTLRKRAGSGPSTGNAPSGSRFSSRKATSGKFCDREFPPGNAPARRPRAGSRSREITPVGFSTGCCKNFPEAASRQKNSPEGSSATKFGAPGSTGRISRSRLLAGVISRGKLPTG